jgi:transmembrane sensor
MKLRVVDENWNGPQPSEPPAEPPVPDGPPPESERKRGSLGSWLRLLLAAACVVAIFALKEAVFWNPPLSFTVGDSSESGVLRDWESAPDDAPLPIRFSDGTLVELAPEAQARVVAVGRAGGEIVIESGRASVRIVPAHLRLPGESDWRVSLGPFSIDAKGTRFDVDWEPRTDDFSLDVREGTVEVSGCERGVSRTLHAGQGVRASCDRQQWTPVAAAPERPLSRQVAAPAVQTPAVTAP